MHLQREGRCERFEIVFFKPGNEPGNRLGPKAVKHLRDEMARRGIRTHLGHKLKRFEADKGVTEGREFAAEPILFMPDWLLPSTRLRHGAKRGFAWNYLRQYH